MKYIDIHSHLSFNDYGNDLKKVINKMKEFEVSAITIGTDLESSKEAVKIANENENIFACIGAHPNDKKNFVFEEKDFEELVKNPKVVAIGECGLDYFKIIDNIEAEKNRQKKEFVKQIEFAIKYNKPLMFHIRDAYEDVYEILKKYKGKIKGNLHFFAGNLEWAKKFIDLNLTISFTGVITFARQYDEVIKNISLVQINAETDSPYIAPIPYRGKRNEPIYIIEIIKKIAEIRGENFEMVKKQLLENAKKIFGLTKINNK
ncbi:MAG: TatD family hydrolase [bacterium]